MDNNNKRKSNFDEEFKFRIHNVLGSSYLRSIKRASAAPIADAPSTIRNKGITLQIKRVPLIHNVPSI